MMVQEAASIKTSNICREEIAHLMCNRLHFNTIYFLSQYNALNILIF